MNFIHKLEPKFDKLSLFHKSKSPSSVHPRSGLNSHFPSTRSHANPNAGFGKNDAKSGNDNKNKLGFKDFIIQKTLGRGSFGKVLLVTRKHANTRPGQSDEHYALKCIKKDSILQDDNVGSIMVERDILKLGANNPFITRLEAAFQNEVSL